jgi:hypothetical protein
MTRPTAEQQSVERPIVAPAQLLVEGRTPEMFFREFVQELGLRERIDVRTFGGISELQVWIELFTAKATFKEKVASLAIVRDAESEPAAIAFQSICSALSQAKLVVPTAIASFTSPPLRVGVYVLPDCNRAGILETLCLEAAAESEANAPIKFLPCVDEFFHCIETATTFDNPTKARFSAYALARGVVDPQLGRAAQKRVISCHAKVFGPLAEFLKQLAS